MKEKSPAKRRWLSAACALLVIAIMVYLFHDIFNANYNNGYETVTTDEIVQQATVNLKAFIIRDEEYIDGESSGTVVPLVSDGKRVASGDAVARVCKSEKDAADYAALEAAREERERYVSLSNQTELNALDMQKLNTDIENCYADILRTASGNNFSTLSENVVELEKNLAEKQLLGETQIDFSGRIAAADKKIAELEALNINPNEVTAPLSGYYISNIDGYEKTFDYSKVNEITVDQVEKLLKAKPAEVNGKMGKIVGSYKWYLAATVDSKYEKILSTGKNLKVNLPYYGLKNVSVRVENLSPAKGDKSAIILSCNLMNETYANMRTVDAELVLDEYSGYKVPAAAVRSASTEDGKKVNVVYILRGEIMTARAIDIIYTPKDEDYVIVSMNTQNVTDPKSKKVLYSAIKRYDEVIVKGRNLENGKSVG